MRQILVRTAVCRLTILMVTYSPVILLRYIWMPIYGMLNRELLANKTLQATAAALCALAVARTHNAVVAGVSAPPAAVPELTSEVIRQVVF